MTPEPNPSQRKLALLAMQSSRRFSAVEKHRNIVKEDTREGQTSVDQDGGIDGQRNHDAY